jgi:dihydrofolate reductase
MGATTYRLMSGFAAQTPEEPGMAELTAQPKVVFSSTLEEPLTWANTELVGGDAVAAVRAMKQESGRPMRTLGSLALSRSLLQAGLVDRYRVVVFPVITGATGRDRIFDGYPDVTLELVDHAPSTTGCRCSSTSPQFSTARRAPLSPRAPEEHPRTRNRADHVRHRTHRLNPR